jgi:RNA polymerase sigma-70 factor (ECF subfamily)
MNASEFKLKLLPLHASLYRLAFKLMGNEDDAKDVVQDAYLKLWKTRDKIANVDNPLAYCLTVVKNMCLDRHRAAGIALVDKPPEELLIAGGDSASQHIERQQTHQLLNQCLARLPAQQQQVLRMRDLAGCSMQEIEKATGLTAVNARVLLSRARKSLRNQLQKYHTS